MGWYATYCLYILFKLPTKLGKDANPLEPATNNIGQKYKYVKYMHHSRI